MRNLNSVEYRVAIVFSIYAGVLCVLFSLLVLKPASWVGNHPDVVWSFRYLVIAFIIVWTLCAIYAHRRIKS